MSEEALISVSLLILGVIFLLTVSAWRESRAMNKQHQATIEQDLVQKEEFEQLIAKLQQHPFDVDSHNALLTFCRQKRSFTESAYRSVLDLVSHTEGDAAVKLLAEKIGRLSCGARRRDGKPTFSDERAIQNDIQNRC
jgi:hypothetical protein